MNDICVPSTNKTIFGINITLHVTILFAFLSIFFVMYVSKLEQNAINGQLQDQINNAVVNGLQQNDKYDTAKHALGLLPLDTLSKLYQGQDPTVTAYNSMLFTIIIVVNVAMLLMVIVTYGIMHYICDQCPPIQHLIMENAVIFACVGIVEYLFFTKIAINYVPTTPSLMINSIFSDLKKYLG